MCGKKKTFASCRAAWIRQIWLHISLQGVTAPQAPPRMVASNCIYKNHWARLGGLSSRCAIPARKVRVTTFMHRRREGGFCGSDALRCPDIRNASVARCRLVSGGDDDATMLGRQGASFAWRCLRSFVVSRFLFCREQATRFCNPFNFTRMR